MRWWKLWSFHLYRRELHLFKHNGLKLRRLLSFGFHTWNLLGAHTWLCWMSYLKPPSCSYMTLLKLKQDLPRVDSEIGPHYLKINRDAQSLAQTSNVIKKTTYFLIEIVRLVLTPHYLKISRYAQSLAQTSDVIKKTTYFPIVFNFSWIWILEIWKYKIQNPWKIIISCCNSWIWKDKEVKFGDFHSLHIN